MVINRFKKMWATYVQDNYIFPVKNVPPCNMRLDETFNNREKIEIKVFETEKSKQNKEPDAILRGILCRAITHNAPTIIFALGQSQNAEEAKQFIPENLFHHLNVVLVNYRGYGVENGTDEQKERGSTGKPSQKALEDDILRVYDHMKKRFKLRNFYGVGVSLGTALITHLSKHRKIEGQLLVAPFDQMLKVSCDVLRDVFKVDVVDETEVKNMLNHPFDSISNMQGNNTRTHVIRAGADTYVKPARTLNLIDHIKNMGNHIVVDYADHRFEGSNPHIRMTLRYAIGTILSKFVLEVTEKPKPTT